MKKIELFDIITLENDEEYTLIKKLKKQEKEYLLIAPVNEEENPDLENAKIVEMIEENNKVIIEDVENTELLEKLSNEFLALLRKEGI